MDSQGMAPFMWRQVQPEAEVVRLAKVEECGVRRLWPGRIPLGKMSLLAGVLSNLRPPGGASSRNPLGRSRCRSDVST